jgi:amidase
MSDQLMFRAPRELAALVREGELSARELVSESLARIEALEPRLGAFVEVDRSRSRTTARSPGCGSPRAAR